MQGHGAYENMRDTCLTVILDCIKDKHHHWPDEADRLKMSQLIWEKYGWPNCVGYLDGTLFPLFSNQGLTILVIIVGES